MIQQRQFAGVPTAWNLQYTIVYTGFVAGTVYTHKGGGANQQCLPLDPEYNSFSTAASKTTIAGTEYQDVSPIFNGINDQNVPCARCYSRNSAVMMLPAKRTCPQGWTKEYEGKKYGSF